MEPHSIRENGYICEQATCNREYSLMPATRTPSSKMQFEIADARTVIGEDGVKYDILKAIDALHWVHQLCPLMPHDYAVLFKSPHASWLAVDWMLGHSADSYRAYFRGYPRPNRYWDGPDGMRYWRTGMMLNRCEPDSVEPLRLVADGAAPIKDWDGPPWAPNHSRLYTKEADGKWWPRFSGTDLKPCKACVNKAHPWP